MAKTLCPTCGYQLARADPATCPECGGTWREDELEAARESVRRATRTMVWQCRAGLAGGLIVAIAAALSLPVVGGLRVAAVVALCAGATLAALSGWAGQRLSRTAKQRVSLSTEVVCVLCAVLGVAGAAIACLTLFATLVLAAFRGGP